MELLCSDHHSIRNPLGLDLKITDQTWGWDLFLMGTEEGEASHLVPQVWPPHSPSHRQSLWSSGGPQDRELGFLLVVPRTKPLQHRAVWLGWKHFLGHLPSQVRFEGRGKKWANQDSAVWTWFSYWCSLIFFEQMTVFQMFLKQSNSLSCDYWPTSIF